MSELNYVPSWLDSAMTLLEKLNKCIEKIETIVNTVVSVTKTANDALNLANTNKADVTAIQGDITRLDNNISSTRELTDQALSTANRAETKADEATAAAISKSPKLYLHQITIQTPDGYRLYFWTINEESEYYKNKFESETQFEVTLTPLGAKLLKVNNTSITKCLTLDLTAISFKHVKVNGHWENQNSNGLIEFAAYLDDNNQIVTITNKYEWYAATIVAEYVKAL